MLTYKKYKNIYKTATFFDYVYNHVLYRPRRWLRIPYCTYMCLRYPFLYPRNRFTGLHYNNWKILDYKSKLYQKYCVHIFLKDGVEDYSGQYSNELYYDRCGNMITYWKNWWSKPLHSLIGFFHNYVLQVLFCLPTFIEWDAVEKGWKKAFGNQYLKDLKKQLKKDKILYKWRITQIKEKFGTFRLYCNYGSNELYNLIDKYEKLSWETCINCGKPSTHISTGWISPYCEECAKKEQGMNFVTIEEFKEKHVLW